MVAINWADPCARATALKEAKYRLVSGSQESEVEYTGNGVTRRAKYSQADLSVLENEIRTAVAECAALTGNTEPRRRFAIQAGSRRIG